MQLHQLKPIHRYKSGKRVGRGGKRGTYSGRGVKGQKARAGKKPRAGFGGGTLPFKRFPKQRGAGGKTKIKKGTKLYRWRQKPIIINLEVLEKKFKNGEVVSPQTLFAKGCLDKIRKRLPVVKILGEGKIVQKLTIENCRVSKQAQEKIKKAGGKILGE